MGMLVEQEAGDAFAITSSLEEVIIEPCDENDANKYHVRVEVLLDQIGSTSFSAAVGTGSSSSYLFSDTKLASDNILQWKTACQDICSAGNDVPSAWGQAQDLVASVDHADLTSSVDVSANVAVTGNPCPQQKDIDAVVPTLSLHKQAANAAAGSCDASITDQSVNPRDNICAIFKTPVELLDSEMKITKEELFKKMGSEFVVDSRSVLSTHIGTGIAADSEVTGDFTTNTTDAGAEFKLVVHYELEAGEENIQSLNDVPSPSHDYWEKQNQAEKDQAQVNMSVFVIVGVSFLILVVIGWMANNKCNKRNTFVVETKPATTLTGKSGYAPVRRSERFSVTRF